ncbi:TadE/TadG family type IV pilus assembly protein [Sinorhizobium americanum]|uniref:Flp pilus assembly protein TadG n=1 Tax=Sinorhizobium americanum TaxID=194963 RepID=A0A4R2BXL5_9HYPH|nr:TadE/TadG family type IV pilus assembly protein [Sinorhizobium americanum]TCN32667.1 Flp pilus assembly protein TadG [Sinorhizobium americanum]
MNAFKKILRRRFMFHFWLSEEAAVLTETIIVVPFVTLFAAGILEFGNLFWERMQIDAGLRDAGRYLARCRPTSPTYPATCSVATAKRIAFYGTQSSAATKLRVPGWGLKLSDITVPVDANGNLTVDLDSTFTISTAHQYKSSPLFGWLGIDDITISASHEERYMGW